MNHSLIVQLFLEMNARVLRHELGLPVEKYKIQLDVLKECLINVDRLFLKMSVPAGVCPVPK